VFLSVDILTANGSSWSTPHLSAGEFADQCRPALYSPASCQTQMEVHVYSNGSESKHPGISPSCVLVLKYVNMWAWVYRSSGYAVGQREENISHCIRPLCENQGGQNLSGRSTSTVSLLHIGIDERPSISISVCIDVVGRGSSVRKWSSICDIGSCA
jgi:hypothetical protein